MNTVEITFREFGKSLDHRIDGAILCKIFQPPQITEGLLANLVFDTVGAANLYILTDGTVLVFC